MAKFTLPPVRKYYFTKGQNYIVQLFKKESEIKEFSYVSGTPFILKKGEDRYFITNKIDEELPDGCDYALLTSRMPTKKDFISENLKILRWIKHPLFEKNSPSEITNSWKGKFNFIKEDLEEDIEGLRSPQIQALYAILSHCQNPEDRGIVVMPTGTGKTETMISVLISNQCNKLLVVVPSDSLRTQISEKFIGLGLLKKLGVVNDSCKNPIVGVIGQQFENDDEFNDFLAQSNVVVATMSILNKLPFEKRVTMSNVFSHLFVDEAHHSEASTWKNFIELFDKEKVLLFTATPFRNDGRNLNGKFISTFSLRNAQKQGYYKEINFLPIREYDKKVADKKIADKAVEQLRKDIADEYDHIIMARCVNKNRAIEVFEYYSVHEDLKPILIYTGVPNLKSKVEAIKNKQHRIIVCVNMLGEGFDLPELKIAAIHDERQSIPVTLQFIGRFTRTSYDDNLGNASLITNIAYPPIQKELSQLHAKDTDWNLLLPIISEEATEKEINFNELLNGFNNLDKSNIPFQNINPAMSSVVYKNNGNDWRPKNWRDGIANIDSYEHQFSDHNPEKNVLVIVLGKVKKVEWGSFDVVKNMEWSMVVVYWDFRPDKNLVFIHTSAKEISTDKLMDAIFVNEFSPIKGMDVFKIFHNVKRLTLYNVGARKGIGKDISFQSFFGRGVQDGIKHLEQGTLIKNNIFGVGFKEGERISLGCSVKGKIWSYLRGNLNELIEWCREMGDILENSDIDPNTVLENTLIPVTVFERPDVSPISVDWHPMMYQYAENRFEFIIDDVIYDMSDSELNIMESPLNEPIRFSFSTEDNQIEYQIILGSQVIDEETVGTFEIQKLSDKDPIVEYGTNSISLTDFLQKFTPTIWFADGSSLVQNRLVKPKQDAGTIPLDNILTDGWNGVSKNKEAQGIYPYEQDSIQYYFIQKILNDFQIVYDDDGKGEIADVIGINDEDHFIDVHLFHLKYAKGGNVGNDISNFYEVCGQAQKSLSWKYREGRNFFDHLLRRKVKTKNGNSCSRLIKGTEEDLESLLNAAKWTKEMRFHICIVQPSLNKNNASEDILLLLGNTYHYLHTVGNVNLIVYAS
ncbi:MAG: hypothetical protein Wins2KO_31730 [Winogradskyella sp.]